MNTTTTIEKMIDSIAAVCIDLGLRGGYTPEEITDLVCDIAFAHMYDALRDRAETVYAYSTDGDRSTTLKYRSRKLLARHTPFWNTKSSFISTMVTSFPCKASS